jgi:hypothetical protein
MKHLAMLLLGGLVMALASGAAGQAVEQWGRYEIVLESRGAYDNPFRDVRLSARFTCQDTALSVQGFHDGGRRWVLRVMPTRQGRWTYTTASNDPALDGKTGTFDCGPPSPGNHGPIVVRNQFHFAWADGSPYFPVGTTLYNWVHREEALQEATLKTLAGHGFNKVRFCIFPKWYEYNQVEPPLYPWPKKADGSFDRDRLNPDYFRHIERRIADLERLGITSDLILFHPYDHWGHSRMTRAQDDAYLTYAVARLAPFRTVWWTMANEYDLMKAKTMDDWDHFFQTVRDLDPYGHPRANHNCGPWYDHGKPWVTHCNIQEGGGDLYEVGVKARRNYGKPVLIDEYGYEGDIPQGWGNRSAQEETHRHWGATMAGGYASHGETYENPEGNIWWAVGGRLVGQSPARLAFLHKILTALPYEQMAPDAALAPAQYALVKPGEVVLVYFRTAAPVALDLAAGRPWKVDVVDTWAMTETASGTAAPGPFTFTPPRPYTLLRLTRYAAGEALRPDVKVTAQPSEGVAPLEVRFSAAPANLKVRWDFGDGATSDAASPIHVYAQPGLYTAAVTATSAGGAAATAWARVAVDEKTLAPVVRFGFAKDEFPEPIFHGPARRLEGGGVDLGAGEPWKWVAVGDAAIERLSGARSLTVMGWVRAESLDQGAGGNRIACNLDAARTGFDLVCLGDGRLRLAVNEWPDTSRTDSSLGRVAKGRWTFFAVTYDASAAADNVRWYFGDADTPAALDRTVTYARGPLGAAGRLVVGNYSETLHRHGMDRQFRGALRGLVIMASRTSGRAALDLESIRRHQKGE